MDEKEAIALAGRLRFGCDGASRREAAECICMQAVRISELERRAENDDGDYRHQRVELQSAHSRLAALEARVADAAAGMRERARDCLKRETCFSTTVAICLNSYADTLDPPRTSTLPISEGKLGSEIRREAMKEAANGIELAATWLKHAATELRKLTPHP